LNKKVLRQQYLKIRNSLSKAEVLIKSRKIIARLIELDVYHEADIVLTYINYGNEVRTIELVKLIFSSQSKQVFCPKVNGDEIEFYEIRNLNELATGYKGIPEPVVSNGKQPLKIENEEKKCLLIMPGVVFDEECGRIGYGSGYYDRFLGNVIASKASTGEFAKRSRKHFHTIALAYECQIAPFVPMSEFDKKPDMIVTEDRLIVIK